MIVVSSSTWKSSGASVIGPGHILTATPNQDAWTSFHRIWGHGVVASDGVGSRPLSNYGSIAACRAVQAAARRFAAPNTSSARPGLLGGILEAWIQALGPLAPDASAATCIFALCLGDGIMRLGLLGDGCAAVVKKDGAVVALGPTRDSSFSNQTHALTPSVTDRDWKVCSIPEQECSAAILCTDGISDDLEDLEGFMLQCSSIFGPLPQVAACRAARAMLDGWPVPKHSDDKTIACLFRSEPPDA